MSRIFTPLLFTWLFAAILLSSCSKPTLTQAQIDPALSILIPPDTILLVAINVEKLKKTPIYEKRVAPVSWPQVDKLGSFTGIDPMKDLWQLLYISDGKHSVLLARGDFQSDMETRLEKNGAKITMYKTYHLVGDERASVVFFNTSAAAVGDVESLKALLDARGKANGPPPAMAARMKEIPPETQLWAVYTGGGQNLPFNLPGNWSNLNRIAASVDTASIYFDFRDGIQGVAKPITPTDADGKQLNDAFKGLLGLGRLSVPPNQPDLLRILEGVKVVQEGPAVVVTIKEPADLVDKLLDLVGTAGASVSRPVVPRPDVPRRLK